jgi:hypothetical protein
VYITVSVGLTSNTTVQAIPALKCSFVPVMQVFEGYTPEYCICESMQSRRGASDGASYSQRDAWSDCGAHLLEA